MNCLNCANYDGEDCLVSPDVEGIRCYNYDPDPNLCEDCGAGLITINADQKEGRFTISLDEHICPKCEPIRKPPIFRMPLNAGVLR